MPHILCGCSLCGYVSNNKMDLLMQECPVNGQVELHVRVGIGNMFVGWAFTKLLDNLNSWLAKDARPQGYRKRCYQLLQLTEPALISTERMELLRSCCYLLPVNFSWSYLSLGSQYVLSSQQVVFLILSSFIGQEKNSKTWKRVENSRVASCECNSFSVWV